MNTDEQDKLQVIYTKLQAMNISTFCITKRFRPTGRKARWPIVVIFRPLVGPLVSPSVGRSVNICISETAGRISFKFSGIVLWVNTRKGFFLF